MLGLGEEWERVLKALERVIPHYEEMNRIISFGMDSSLREEGTRMLEPSGMVLDAGSGPGSLSKVMWRRGGSDLVLVDPLLPMLEDAKRRLEGVSLINSEFEHMPFRDEAFDRIACAFSLRDARDLELALDELSRCLKWDGKLLILDLSKPDNVILRSISSIYLRIFVPLMALLKLGRDWVAYIALYRTYKRLPREGRLLAELSKRFEDVEVERRMLGAVHLIIASKVKVNKRRDSR